ncbi:MAG TPA: TrkA family potassium uptake protein [Deltaproteobacteria bacterium]|nr:TrkA family potassium uptake protein [Deltaproteobacteria bacterium]
MKVIVSGGGDIGRVAAETLSCAGHDLTVIEKDRGVCEVLASELDVMVVCGDATRPDLLEKAGIEDADLVMAASGDDHMNVITAVVAREYGIDRVIIRLDDPAFNTVCRKLGMEEIVNPKIAAAKQMADMARRPHALELSTLVGGSIRVFTAILRKPEHAVKIDELDLPPGALPTVVQRNGEYFIAGRGFRLMEGDHLSILCDEKDMEALTAEFGA